jgi:hypothetical protein
MEIIAALLSIAVIWGVYNGLDGSPYQVIIPALILGAPIIVGFLNRPDFEGSTFENLVRYYTLGWDIIWENFKNFLLSENN